MAVPQLGGHGVLHPGHTVVVFQGCETGPMPMAQLHVPPLVVTASCFDILFLP
jgi:hypothetical protein